MKLNKKDIKLICAFIGTNYPKVELNYALVSRGGIFATDTRKAIMFHAVDLDAHDMLVHKKLLKGFESTLGKNDIATVSTSDIKCNDIRLHLDTADWSFNYPDHEKILDQELENHFVLSSLSDILFELTSKHCFIDSFHLAPLIDHGDADKYDVFYTPQTEKNSGLVKVVASRFVDEEEVVLYTSVVIGREFKSQAKY